MYLCYIDESGTPEIPGNTSHFILAGLSIPIWHWRSADRGITMILRRYAPSASTNFTSTRRVRLSSNFMRAHFGRPITTSNIHI
jgi:hypothetical protein